MIMKVSVIIPTYNRVDVISRAAQSVLDQTVSDFELIIVDDQSSDSTEEEVRKLQDKDERVRYIKHKENRGGSSARNTGISQARGEYLAFLDSDDEWLPEKLEKQLNLFENSAVSDLGAIYTWKKIIDEKEEIIDRKDFKGEVLYNFLSGMGVSTSTLIIKKEVISDCGKFDENLNRLGGQDADFYISVSKKYNFDYVPDVLVKKYKEGDNITSLENASKLIKAKQYILNKHKESYRKFPHAKARVLRNIGTYFMIGDNMKEAQKFFLSSVKHDPWQPRNYLNLLLSFLGSGLYKKIFYRKRHTNRETVYFFGLPGSGKSYMAKNLAQEQNYKIISTNKPGELFWSFLFFISHPVLSIRILALLSRENKKNKRILIHKLRLFIKVASLQSKSFFFNKPLIDDGFCQFVLAIFDRKIKSKDLQIAKKMLSKNAKIIIVESSNKKRMSRMKQRGRTPRSFMGEDYLKYIFPIWDHNCEIIKDYYIANFNTQIIKN